MEQFYVVGGMRTPVLGELNERAISMKEVREVGMKLNEIG